MEKYNDLPGIETGSPDVFETSDIESEQEIEVPQQEETEVIHEASIDPQSIRKKYANDVIIGDMEVVDFSGSIHNPVLGTKGYHMGTVDETREQRLGRIARELQEIQLIDEKEGVKSDKETKDLSELLEKLMKNEKDSRDYQFDDRLKRIFSTVSTKINEDTSISEHSKPRSEVSSLEVLALEERLNKLESLIGMDQSKTTSVQSVLNDLGRKIRIIHNPEYPLSKVKDEITRLSPETQQLASQRKVLELTETALPEKIKPTEDKVDQLYSKLEDFERVNKSVPSIISRLKTLNVVHADIGYSVEIIKELDGVISSMNDEFKGWDESINVLSSNLEAYAKITEENKEEINSRIAELENRLQV